MRTLFLIAVAIIGVAALAAVGGAQPPPAPAAAPCPHTIDAARCPFCDPTRIERLGMCKEHGVPEALCVRCKPYLKGAFIAEGDWCEEHDRPESQCRVCNPEIAEAEARLARSAGNELRWRREPSMTCVTSSQPVALSSAAIAQTVGFEYTRIEAGPVTRTIERNVQIAYNANRYARLSARAGGVVTDVLKDLGEPVKKGDVLAIVDSTDVGSAKNDLLMAVETARLWESNAAREKGLLERGVGIEREALEAETSAAESRIELNRVRQRLRNLGLTAEQIAAIETGRDTSSLLPLNAPFDGTVVERAAVMGEVVEAGKPLLAVANTSAMWAMVDFTEADLPLVRVGQEATVTVDGLPGRTFKGRVTWVSTELDPATRTLRARIELDNADGLLRANMFGRARVSAGESRQALTVPKDAVQWEGCCNVAFVRADDTGTTFRPARLMLAFDAGDRYEVADGLKPGDMVVTRGSFILKNEVLKDSVGAGCCEVDHLKK